MLRFTYIAYLVLVVRIYNLSHISRKCFKCNKTFRDKKKVEYVNNTEIVNAAGWCYIS